MTRSLLTLMALACVFATGCPGDGGKKDDTGPATDDSVTAADEDGDGYLTSDGDCDDSNPDINPAGTEICDGNDNDCDGEIDEDGATEYYMDADGDGFGDDNSTAMACEPEAGYVATGGDCDDSDETVYPDATEVCDGLDNDCDGDVDEELSTTYYRDNDGDGYGDPTFSTDSCTDPEAGWVTNADDCDDSEPLAYDGATEVCDGVDNDCNGFVDDGLSSTWYPDVDQDGYGDDSAAFDSCTDPGRGYLSVGGDCDDTESLAWTGALEVCDDVDNDCNGLVDDDAVDATAQIADTDGDGFGSPTDTEYACEALVDNTLDCDDGNAREPQVVDDSASSSSADGSITNPWTTIQEGIDAARMCVVVYAGSYYENVDFGGNDVSVTSVDGWADTIIDGSGYGSVVTFSNGESSGASLDGFTIQNGGGLLDLVVTSTTDGSGSVSYSTYNRYYGGGVYVDGATPTLSNLYVTDNILPVYDYTIVSSTEDSYTLSYGGGIFVTDSSGMEMTGVSATWNYAYQGGGVYGADSASFEMSQGSIGYNEASDGGGLATQGTLELTNVIVAGNSGDTDGGGLYIEGGTSTWWNVTAVGNEAPSGAGVAVIDGGTFYLYSSTISDSNVGEGVYAESASTFSATYSNLYGNDTADSTSSTTTGNITVDPGFTDWTDDGTDNDDLSLAARSALIDAGNPSSSYYDADGSRNDIGAYGGPGGGW